VKLTSTGLQMQVRPLPDRRQQLNELLGSDSVEPGEFTTLAFSA
jgi:hypothetical protein